MTQSTSGMQSRAATQFVLHPHRSLSSRGFLILMTALGVVSFIAGVVFCLIGAWPVMGFFGLDVALIYWAFKVNYRDGQAYETVDITSEALTLTRVASDGVTDVATLNPYWARVRLGADHPDGRTTLSIVADGKALSLGAFLTDDERRDFASALKDALHDARNPRFDTA